MRARLTGCALVAAAILVVVNACDGGGATGPPTNRPTTSGAVPSPSGLAATTGPSAVVGHTCDRKLKVGLVTDVGRITDRAYNQAVYEGMLAAVDESPSCLDPDYLETTSASDYAKNIAEFADNDYDVIIGVGSRLADPLAEAARGYPDIRFIAVDGTPGGRHEAAWARNGQSLLFAEDEVAYLAGVLAASLSASGTIAVVGGAIGSSEALVEGYTNGARAARQDIVVRFGYLESPGDAEAGRAAADEMIGGGADVVFAATASGGQTDSRLGGNGAIVAACTAEILAIGAEIDQYAALPEAQRCLVSSAVKNVTGAVHRALRRIAGGAFVPGVHVHGAATDGIALAPFRTFEGRVPGDVRDLLERTYRGLATGAISTGVVVDGETARQG